MGQAESSIYNSLERSSNCMSRPIPADPRTPTLSFSPFRRGKSADTVVIVSGPELLRLKKRFMKLDKDGSGSIDRDEFLQIPQIANNPLAHRMIAIFDDEYVTPSRQHRAGVSISLPRPLVLVSREAGRIVANDGIVEVERSTFKSS